MVLPKRPFMTRRLVVKHLFTYSNSLLFHLVDCLFAVSELSQHQHGGNDGVGGQGKNIEDFVSGFTEARVSDLPAVCSGTIL